MHYEQVYCTTLDSTDTTMTCLASASVDSCFGDSRQYVKASRVRWLVWLPAHLPPMYAQTSPRGRFVMARGVASRKQRGGLVRSRNHLPLLKGSSDWVASWLPPSLEPVQHHSTDTLRLFKVKYDVVFITRQDCYLRTCYTIQPHVATYFKIGASVHDSNLPVKRIDL